LRSHWNTVRIYHRADNLIVILNSLRIVLIVLYIWLSENRHNWNNWVMENIVAASIPEFVSKIAEHNEHKESKNYSTADKRSTSNN
jgi:hypothetical protein